jgi:hypothetical protein
MLPYLTEHLSGRRRGRIALVLAIIVSGAAALAAGMVAARPARVFGYDGRSLGYSVADSTGGAPIVGFDPCRRKGREWECDGGSDGSSAALYRVRADSRGCWTARLVIDGPGDPPRRTSGCIAIWDYVNE